MKLSIITIACVLVSFSTIKAACNCGKEFEIETVCGFNGVTYKNPCFAKCNEALIAYYGACSDTNVPCGCPSDDNAVCDLNGNVYLNECVANCKGMVAIPFDLCQTGATLDDNANQEIPLVVRDDNN